MRGFALGYIDELNVALKSIDLGELSKTKDALLSARDSDNNIFVVGNGGSASTASHMACDIGKGVLGHTGEKKIKRFRIMSLNDNIATMTAWSNDTSFDDVFAEQLENLANKGDVLVAISASGNSSNIIKAVNVAKKKGCKIIGFVGFDGGKLKKLSDICLWAKVDKYDVSEDVHLIFEHILTRWFFENIQE